MNCTFVLSFKIQLLLTLVSIILFTYHLGVRKFTIENIWIFYAAVGIGFVTFLTLMCCESVRYSWPINLIVLFIFTIAWSCLIGLSTLLAPPELVVVVVVLNHKPNNLELFASILCRCCKRSAWPQLLLPASRFSPFKRNGILLCAVECYLLQGFSSLWSSWFSVSQNLAKVMQTVWLYRVLACCYFPCIWFVRIHLGLDWSWCAH